jgi:hypothetical protein
MFRMLRFETNTLKKLRIIHRIGFKRQRYLDQLVVILLILFLKSAE